MRADKQVSDTYAFRTTLDSAPESVSTALREVRCALSSRGGLAQIDPSWEIVVAEVLNNIVEHAYQSGEGKIYLSLEFRSGPPAILLAEFTDFGRPMPDGKPPVAKPANLDVQRDDLPEGGFGWAMIHALVSSLVYHRNEGCNNLSLEMPLH